MPHWLPVWSIHIANILREAQTDQGFGQTKIQIKCFLADAGVARNKAVEKDKKESAGRREKNTSQGAPTKTRQIDRQSFTR